MPDVQGSTGGEVEVLPAPLEDASAEQASSGTTHTIHHTDVGQTLLSPSTVLLGSTADSSVLLGITALLIIVRYRKGKYGEGLRILKPPPDFPLRALQLLTIPYNS